MEYCIVRYKTLARLSKEVNRLMKAGWTVNGALVMDDVNCIQTMIKDHAK